MFSSCAPSAFVYLLSLSFGGEALGCALSTVRKTGARVINIYVIRGGLENINKKENKEVDNIVLFLFIAFHFVRDLFRIPFALVFITGKQLGRGVICSSLVLGFKVA